MDSLRLEPQRHAAAPVDRADAQVGAARGDFARLALAPERRAALALFLRHLARGERVAQSLAGRQAAIAPTRHERRFLRAQARQEAMHALLFDTAASWLGARALALDPCPYAAFEARASAAVERGDLVESLIATQIVLEALGEVLLERLDRGLARHGAGFQRLRRVLLRQEAAHHAFGRRIVERARAGLVPASSALPALALPYLDFVDAMIASGRPALAHFGLTPAQIGAEARARLPSWLER
jgi:hypothetical protein